MTKEQALMIVKKAESEYDPNMWKNEEGSNSVDCVGRIVGWWYCEGRWQQQLLPDCTEYASTEQVAEELARRINEVENILFVEEL